MSILNGGNDYLKDGLFEIMHATRKAKPHLTIFQQTTPLVIQTLIVRAHACSVMESRGQFEIAAMLCDPDVSKSELIKAVGREAIEKMGDAIDGFPSVKGVQLFLNDGQSIYNDNQYT